MPTQTFFNLPNEKRERIINAATEEFASYSFSQASIARIIEQAGISRGSFYQYFEDIKDVYKFIFEKAGQEKLVYIYDVVSRMNELNTFVIMKELYKAGLRFANDHPRLAQMGNKFYKEEESVRNDVIEGLVEKSHQFYEGLLLTGIEKGDVDPKIDVKIASRLFYTMNLAVVENYLTSSGQEHFLDDIDGYLLEVDKMLYILEHGLKKKD
ncbi:TetR/AcrR family transcriptional regulator [Anaerobacillus isosaccharinicus]|uniref:TetR/AcrR family transcriptional regulator n=1 Tax=Anaerobacillus isosaccharinicus TaxID=1532552 RepID=A0A1S2KV28_9BACI|nr:TetR/AcrR family transcriptional regulator [Anaerobacillus isosaccharinicus]MBA5588033.1 TetR/AcrR family transcriptional regulator [Anaerobacillus isosaccharinicus]QOY33827.1 TetR/AcrR family transcriptional regulator [Anaerobacillus isosaccharinicus]